MLFTVLVHPVDTKAHPTVPYGTWRWAVMVGDETLNAGAQPTKYDAAIIGEAAMVVGLKTARAFGVADARYTTTFLDHDPIAPDNDAISFL